jgi:hypothetical protein
MRAIIDGGVDMRAQKLAIWRDNWVFSQDRSGEKAHLRRCAVLIRVQVSRLPFSCLQSFPFAWLQLK